MRWLGAVAVVVVFGCGSVTSKKPDAGVDALPPGSATLTLAQSSSWVAQGKSVSISLTIARGATVTGALTVHVTGSPAGVDAPDVAIAAGATTGSLTISATSAATLASSTDLDVQLLDGANMLDHKPFNVFVAGVAGTLDTTYGGAGHVTIPLPDPVIAASTGNGFSRAIAQYPASAGANAGKLVVAAQLETTGTASSAKKIAVVRLNKDGTLDTTFNTTGYVLISSPAAADRFIPSGVAIDSQGRVAVSTSYFTASGGACNTYVTRLTATGAADTGFTTFSGNPFSYCGYAEDLVVIGGDKLVSLGFFNQPDTSQHATLLQLNSDGTPDTAAFGSAYSIVLPNPGAKTVFQPYRIVVDLAGRYLVVGSYCSGSSSSNSYSACESVVGRITAAGAWDTAFGSAGTGGLGYSSLTFGTSSGPTATYQGFSGVAFDASGNIVTSGWAENYATGTIARWTSTGAVDTTFGTSGRITPVLAAGATVQEVDSIAVDSENRIVGMGYAYLGGGLIATTRYSSTGTIDSDFGTAGVSTAPAAQLQTRGVIQLDGRILVVGAVARGADGADVAVWRFWP